jgi:hypothetical protein
MCLRSLLFDLISESVVRFVHVQIVTLLLEKGADVNARNYCGQVDLPV